MIISFANAESRMVFEAAVPRGIPTAVARVAFRKMLMVDAAVALSDLGAAAGLNMKVVDEADGARVTMAAAPGWKLEFFWQEGLVEDVELTAMVRSRRGA